jgi:hypothetical protein
MTGDKFLRGMMTPIPPKSVFFLLQSGYAADFVLGLSLESFNGLNNRSTGVGELREADPDFLRAVQLIREVQTAGMAEKDDYGSPARYTTASPRQIR